jgi:hypothetical protein
MCRQRAGSQEVFRHARGTPGRNHKATIAAVAAGLLTYDGDGATTPVAAVKRFVEEYTEYGEFLASKPGVKATEDTYLASCPRARNFVGIDPEEHSFLYSVLHPTAIVLVPATSQRYEPDVRLLFPDALELTNVGKTEEGTAVSNPGVCLLIVQSFFLLVLWVHCLFLRVRDDESVVVAPFSRFALVYFDIFPCLCVLVSLSPPPPFPPSLSSFPLSPIYRPFR